MKFFDGFYSIENCSSFFYIRFYVDNFRFCFNGIVVCVKGNFFFDKFYDIFLIIFVLVF